MKTLYLIRHAKSSWAEVGMKDFDRSLEERGLKDAPKMAKLLRGMSVQPDYMVSSPAKRAFTTAQYFALGLDFPIDKIEKEMAIYEAEESALLHIIREFPDDKKNILMFGHNPGFTYFANGFAIKHIENVPTCGIVVIEFTGSKWKDFNKKTATVRDFLYPKSLND
jgi:phosphohistidine phosphatase